MVYLFLVLAALVLLLHIALTTTWWALLALAYAVPAGRALAIVAVTRTSFVVLLTKQRNPIRGQRDDRDDNQDRPARR